MDACDAKLLIVDDTPANLDALEAMLEPTGCELVRAASGEEALLALLQYDFAAIILDIRMPGMDGFDLARLIKQRRRSRDTPILFLTAHLMDRDDMLAGYRLGAVDYMSKPVNGEILRSKISVFIELNRKTQALAAANRALESEAVERSRAQLAVQHANEELEVRVRERTEALTEATRRADAANRAKDEFLAMLGHELRNPLAPMVTALELLRLGGVQSREQDVLERQVRHLIRLVDDLLDVSRITSGKVELQSRPVEAAEVVSRAMEVVSPLLEQRRHPVSVAVPASGLGLLADVDRLAQVLSNLLTNAAKYSEPGSPIAVSGQRDGGHIRLSIADHGRGIMPEMLHDIFEAFVQQPQTLDRSRGGLGLGLAIARSLVVQHGGTIRAVSDGAGQGSTFIVELPAIDLVESLGPKRAAPEAVALDHRPDPVRVLVVDDNDDAATLLKIALTRIGYRVEMAHDAPMALQKAEVFHPDIALLDLGLPVMNGYELAERLRGESARPPRLIAVTGYGQDSDRQRALAAGFEHHLVKPIDLEQLRQVLEATERTATS